MSAIFKGEHVDSVYGRLLESFHFTAYGFERAFVELEWLLEKDRWKAVGRGFEKIDDFLATLDFSKFRVLADQRKKLAARLKAIEVSQRATAKLLGVDETTIRRDIGTRPAANAAPDPNEPLRDKDSSGRSAANAAPGPAAQAALAVRSIGKQAQQAENREERIANIAAISAGNRELDVAVRYPIIYADPPWQYENPPIGASNRSIENHYPTMTLEEICRAPVRELATDDALLYLWATAPKLAECFAVIGAWGFEYRTNLVWDKEIIGMGYHARNQHEILLIAKRGEIPPPPAGKQPSSVHRERRGRHSEKPIHYYEMIEAAYPELAKIELFARAPRKGWAVWGNESEGGLLDISNA